MDNTSPAPSFTVASLVKLKRVAAVAVSPCGTWAAVALERLNREGNNYASDLWRVALDGFGSTHQLTRGNSRDTAPCFRSDGALGFLSNRSDSDAEPDAEAEKRSQVWLLPENGGEAERLTDEPLGASAFKFARSSNCLAVLASVQPGVAHEEQRKFISERNKNGPSALHYKTMPVRYWDHWVAEPAPHLIAYTAEGKERRDVTPDLVRQLDDATFDVSSDGKYFAITYATPGPDRCDDVAILLIETGSGTQRSDARRSDARRILGAETLCELAHPVFSPDGSTIACSREYRQPHQCPSTNLRLIDVQSGDSRTCASAWDAWPTPQDWSADGKSLFVTAEHAACTPIFEIELESGDIMCLTSDGSHSNVCVGPDGNLVGIRSSWRHPPELFQLPRQSAVDLYYPARLSGFDPACVPFTTEQLSILSSDGHPVQAALLKPAGHTDQDAPLPVLMWIHGGPMSSWGDIWHWRWQPLTAISEGYAVLLPNPRGSTGFGQAFIAGIWANTWGKQCYEDLMAVADQIATRADLDANRVAAMGGSFGGYMCNWIGTQTTRFKCLVSHAGVYSMSAFYGVTDLPAFWLLQMDGEPYTDPAQFDRYSPSRFIANWKTPTLIIHGEKDYRVPVSEGLALFEALQYHRVESELLMFPDENHWILKPNNSIVWYQSVYTFLSRHLK